MKHHKRIRKSQKEIPTNLWKDVETVIVKNDMCCGCGICATVCPVKGCITIDFDVNKEYKPFVDHNKCINCGLCWLVCPDNYKLYDRTYNHTHKKEYVDYVQNDLIGPYLEARVGFVNNLDNRRKSASGGILTALLKYMLNEKIVDGVVVAQSIQNRIDEKLCESVIVYSSKDLIDKAGSKYYPIEFSSVIDEIISSKGKTYAIVGVPCVHFALRKLMFMNKEVGKKIKYLFALACGHNVSASFTTFLGQLKGLSNERCKIHFREKDNIAQANDFFVKFTLEDKDNKFIRFLHGNIWGARLFSLNKCLYCTDFWGEFSDACFSDAWLPEYITDTNGTSIVIVRNRDISSYLDIMVNRNIVTLDSIPGEKAVEAQRTQIKFKKEDIKIRIALRKFFHRKAPDYGVKWSYRDLLKIKEVYREIRMIARLKLSKIAYRYGILPRLKTKYFLYLTDPLLIPSVILRKVFKIFGFRDDKRKTAKIAKINPEKH